MLYAGRYVFLLIFIFFLGQPLYSQSDNIGSGRAISFDGVDDYIDFGDIYSDLKLPFTVSGWVYLDPNNTSPAPIFSNRNCDPIYTGFRIIVNSNVISLDYGDGIGGNSPAFRRGKLATVDPLKGTWNHITAVVKDVSDMDLYLNGVNVGGEYVGESNLKMDSSKPGFASSAYFISNGVVYRLKGIIDDIRLWNRALSETEIRNTMCVNLTGNEPGLIGYWDFNEISGNTVFDRSANHHNGTFVGNPARVFSGAPIGDLSTHLYSSSLTGKIVSMTDGDHKINVKNISSTANGVQIYRVKSPPSQATGLGASEISSPYFGVFMARQISSSTFDAEYLIKNSATCEAYIREDNSKSTWTKTTNPSLSQPKRFEIIEASGTAQPIFDLGVNIKVCNGNSYTFSTGITDPKFSFLWSNGAKTPSITVNQSGKYSVTVFADCSRTDSVTIDFLQKPQQFSLGKDSTACSLTSVKLQAPDNSPSYTYTWQDGSTNSSFEAKDFGKYWVTVKNACGEASDTVVFSKYSDPPLFDLGANLELCDGSSYTISTGITDPKFSFLWNNGVKTSSMTVNQSGKYSIIVSGPCSSKKDSIIVNFLKKPQQFSLGKDSTACSLTSVKLQAPDNSPSYTYTWQDGSTNSLFDVRDFGEYWVLVKNACGEASDTVVFSKLNYSSAVTPNVITPNDDGENDYFILKEDLAGLISFKVFSRWGQEVYHTESYDNKWNANDLSAGVYFIILKGPCNEINKGILHVLH